MEQVAPSGRSRGAQAAELLSAVVVMEWQRLGSNSGGDGMAEAEEQWW